jgi:hypothetical protein
MPKKFQVNLDAPAKLINGEPMMAESGQPVIIGKSIADHIAGSATDRNVIKLYHWASVLAKSETLTLDSEELNTLKAFVEQLPRLITVVKAQALELLNEAKQVE